MSKPWGGVGAWALEAEREEAEERELAATATAAPPESFPSLREAAAAKPKKKKGTTLSLSEFTSGTHVSLGAGTGGGGAYRREPSADSKFLTHDEMIRLPTGPKERSAEELENSRLGGGFRSYGYGSGSGGGAAGRRPYGGGFDEEGRRGTQPSRGSDLDMPSRADEADNWGAGKKASSFGQMDSGSRRQDRYGPLGSGSSSKADEVDSWFSNKKPVLAPAPSRYSGFGSGFRDSGGSSDSDRWARGGGGGMMMMSNNGDRDVRERPRLVLDRPKGEVGGMPAETGKTRPSPFGAARPREQVLAEKGLDWRKIDTEIEVKKTSRPTSSHSSRPSSGPPSRPGSPGSQVASGEGAPKARPKVNPFGDAKPREVLLEEKGKDWRKIDSELEHRRVDRPETEEEKLLREEIDNLKKALTEESEMKINGDSEQTSAEQQTSLQEQISQRGKDLKKLIRELDDKVRVGQKAAGSVGSRIPFSADRQPSQSGTFEEPKSMDYMDRPRSHGGTGDSWGKPLDDRRGFQGGREPGFLGNRGMDRSTKREGW